MNQLNNAIYIIVSAYLVVLLADFIGGIVHWAEDTFWQENTPIIGPWLVVPNVIHHTDRGANDFLSNYWAHSSWDLFTAAPISLALAWLFSFLNWQVGLFVFVGALSNQFHRWSHVTVSKVPFPVRVFQRLRIIQDGRHHWQHHRGAKNTHYCVITPYVNPLLDGLGFFRHLERILVPYIGAPRHADLSNVLER